MILTRSVTTSELSFAKTALAVVGARRGEGCRRSCGH